MIHAGGHVTYSYGRCTHALPEVQQLATFDIYAALLIKVHCQEKGPDRRPGRYKDNSPYCRSLFCGVFAF